ncbi:MAG: hypothetical protein LBP22_07630 [Deltaproteobacteria bacterium]|jgi:hypothetical protein|nr:hypothetical protein [Deltaproteobacteria bacterium]
MVSAARQEDIRILGLGVFGNGLERQRLKPMPESSGSTGSFPDSRPVTSADLGQVNLI